MKQATNPFFITWHYNSLISIAQSTDIFALMEEIVIFFSFWWLHMATWFILSNITVYNSGNTKFLSIWEARENLKVSSSHVQIDQNILEVGQYTFFQK